LTIRNRPSLIYYARVLYSFSIRSADGTDRAETGCIELADDSEALAFGKAVIKDMLHDNADQYAGWTMDVAVAGERAVCSIAFPNSTNAT
jgi:hypothetical protein